ncbi:hypothetical protein BHYA_0171g00020 [Botrytis hyacinthi]|uniref:Cytochrome P450 n=1 Tax=Botrytis hyacinthi TaxID=278943 RepID=A0A4Z1GDM3_9HELO|nr:hypothetical protein BHYA_0171g00020 [Botrytis hyacinthi]
MFLQSSRREPHKRLKRFLSPAFSVSYVDNLEFLFSKCLQDLIYRYAALSDSSSSVKNKPAVTDMMNDLHNVALDIMGECSFGKGFGQTNPTKDIDIDIDEDTWEKIPSAIFDGMTKRYQLVYVKRFLRRLGYEVEFDWPKEMISAIKAVTEERGTNPERIRPDLLQHLLDEGQNPATSMKMNVRDVVDHMSEILLAGSETISGTIACFFLEILRNQSVKKKLLESLPILGPEDPIISSKSVRNGTEFEYLEACVKETLRIHPIASEMGRRTGAEPIELMGYLIPPNTVVSASYRELHRNPTHWPDPMRFWPERWLKNRPEGVPPPDFAWAEIRMVTANLLSRYDFSEFPGQSIDWRQYITMQFEGGSWKVSLTPRYAV